MLKITPTVPLNPRILGLAPSATLAIHDRSERLRREGKEIFKLGLGQSPFPVPGGIVAELKRNAHRKSYLPVRGLPELRVAVAEHHRRTFGIDTSPDHVLVGPGSKELMFLLQLAFNGEIIIPTPAWVSYGPQARIIGRTVRWVHTRPENGWRLTPDQLETLCRKEPDRHKLLVLNYPSNPTGGTYPPEELDALAQIARKYRVVILSDEIYGKLHHEGEHRSIAPLYPEGTIFSGGLSKWCGAGGWRLGVFVIPDSLKWLLDAMASVASETFTSTSAPIQYAAVRAFEGGPLIERYLLQCRRVLAALGQSIAAHLKETGVSVLPPMGGFYLFPDFSPFRENLKNRGISTSNELCERLLEETGVALLPGSDFGRPSSELTARLAYVDFDGGKALAAIGLGEEKRPLERKFLKKYCGRVLAAVEHIRAWLHESRVSSEFSGIAPAKTKFKG